MKYNDDINDETEGATHFCEICGHGDTAAQVGEHVLCRRHKPVAIEAWKADGAMTYDRREAKCVEVAKAAGREDYEQEDCDSPAQPNWKCPGCPFKRGWHY